MTTCHCGIAEGKARYGRTLEPVQSTFVPVKTEIDARSGAVLPVATPRRNVNVDALRGLAILLVLGRHSRTFPAWIKVGWAGVDLFFVLSGFLISSLLFSEWQKTGTIDIPRFYIRRAFKIYPAFWILMAVTVAFSAWWISWSPSLPPIGNAIYPMKPTQSRMLTELLFLQGYFPGIWGHTWSLAVEEHFYLALPLMLWLMQRFSPGTRPFRHLPHVFLVVAIVALVLRIATVRHPEIVDLRMDSLLFGVLLGYYRHFDPRTFERIATARIGLVFIAAAVVLIAILPNETIGMQTFGFTVVFLGSGFLLARVMDWKPGQFSSPGLKFTARIGFYSYSIYLWHFAIAQITPRGTVPFALYLAGSVLFGIGMAKLIELPALRLRDRFVPR